MAKSNKSKFALLGMLAIAPKSSGYDLKKLMEKSTHYFWKESYGSIYPVLKALVEEGLVTQHEDPSKSERQRHLYTITAQGKKELREWINKPVEYEQVRNELLLKLFFGAFTPPETTRTHLEEFHQILLEKQKIYQEIKKKLLLDQKNEPGQPYWLMTLEFGLGQVESALKWCKDSLKNIKN